jgi:hypothetical protein
MPGRVKYDPSTIECGQNRDRMREQKRYLTTLPTHDPLIPQDEMVRRIEAVRAQQPDHCLACGRVP